MMTIIATYSGNLVAIFTVVKADVSFETLEDLANQDQYKFGMLGETIYPLTFEVSRSVVVVICLQPSKDSILLKENL